MKSMIITLIFSFLCVNIASSQQKVMPEHLIAVDVAHDPIFWGDPNQTEEFDENRTNRIHYLNSQLQNNATTVGAELYFLHDEITDEDLSMSELLFIHVPSSRYGKREIGVITDYLNNGGSLFLATDVDYWVTLEQSNLNDLINPFGIHFGQDSPDEQVGAMSKTGPVTAEPVKIPYHGGRILEGERPFAFTTGNVEIPFAVYKELDGGGKMVVMSEAMASLYMNSWQGVDDYQTEEFMEAVIQWLMNK